MKVTRYSDADHAGILLAGAIRALLLSVDANLQQQPDRETSVECREIEEKALRQLDSVLRQVIILADSAG